MRNGNGIRILHISLVPSPSPLFGGGVWAHGHETALYKQTLLKMAVRILAEIRRDEIRQAFQNNHELRRFVLPEVRTTGRELGRGAYGSVEELEVNGLVCAGKRLYEVFLEQGDDDVENIVQRYQEECHVISTVVPDVSADPGYAQC